jgi:CRP/FNR family cyclic AMP-dependent transcriptional regulator
MAEGFLWELSREEANALQAVAMRRRYGRNVTILHEGDDSGPVVVLLHGRVKIATTSDAGRQAIVAVRGPGDLLGELAAIDGARRSTSVTTLEPVELLLLSRGDFLALLERHPRMAVVLLRVVASRVRYADAQQAQFSTHDVVGRLAQRLVELCARFGEIRDRGIEIDLAMSQEELASWIGASREGVSKAFGVLRALHIVETGRRHVTCSTSRRSSGTPAERHCGRLRRRV